MVIIKIVIMKLQLLLQLSNYFKIDKELNIESPSKIDELIKLFNKSYIDSGNDIEIEEENIIFTFKH